MKTRTASIRGSPSSAFTQYIDLDDRPKTADTYIDTGQGHYPTTT